MKIERINPQSNPELYKKSLHLRNEILRKPLGLDNSKDDLSFEENQIHFVAVELDEVIGVVVLAVDQPNIGKLRQMATAEQVRGKRVGVALVNSLEDYAKASGRQKVKLHARKNALGFYQKLGYEITSDLFFEVGIPHFAMEKELE